MTGVHNTIHYGRLKNIFFEVPANVWALEKWAGPIKRRPGGPWEDTKEKNKKDANGRKLNIC